ncbi:four-carbon acid sugar kinase family protein [Phytoactinopolyspora mesophila]|uniref:Four-carbon acid sugar kinase family protein n=1 Tax=Phytoactinopolyspora mesophila TaxID=2650750 RepID=A0A7K3M4I7_9ACTN|nr:four-carbon acid sugar kinase family protein [Phytoactinopolyspora mesophila]
MTGNAVLVIADDLTGANATAAGFARDGLRAVTVGADQGAGVVAEFASRFDVVVVSTDARHANPADAAARVTETVRAGWPVKLVSNRIDSTLRGNVGATTEATLKAVAAESGRRAVALCMPAHPQAHRQTVEGAQLLDGVRLEDTELARDPRSPVHQSGIAEVLRHQADLRVTHLPLSLVTGPADAMRQAVREQLAGGADVIVADALTTDHLDRVARAAATAGDADTVWVSVDSGPGSVALASALGITRHAEGAPVLAVSGSATRLTREQLAKLCDELPVSVVRTVPGPEGPDVVPDVDATAAALDVALSTAGPDDVVLLATVLDEADVVDLDPGAAERIPAALARVVRRSLERHTVDGVFSTGGDITAALFAELAAHGLDVQEELVPLAVAGTFVGGPWAGLPVVTKGGLVGDADTTVACVQHLRRAAEASRRHVRTAQSRVSITTPIRRTT